MKKDLFKSLWAKLAIIVGLGFIVRLLVYGFIKIPWIIFDEFIYLDTARQIIRGHFVSNLSRDPQLYPPGWPLILASFTGFFKNPYFQYKAGLILTMLISSLAPVVSYVLVGSLPVALIVSLFPPLFVYSSSIMSETLFIVMILGILAILKYIVKDDLKSNKTLILASVILAFFMFYTRLVRSFGLILLPSFLMSVAVVGVLQAKVKSYKNLKNLVYFSVLVTFFYYLFNYLSRFVILPKGGFYEKQDYIKALFIALKNPRLSFVLLRNELAISFYWLAFILPIFFLKSVKKLIHKKEWYLLLPRIWAVFIYILSLSLTLSHMIIGTTHNPQYLVFSRYIDPSLVVLFVFGLTDLIDYLKTKTSKIKIHPLAILVVIYFLFYLVVKVPKLNYKFGNTMSIYFFLLLQNSLFHKIFLSGLILGVCYWAFKNAKTWLALFLIIFYLYSSILALSATRGTPAWVGEKYEQTATEWELALGNYQTTDIPLCIHRDGISSEIYYLYHFLYPYQYLKPCKTYEQKPRRIVTRKNPKYALPSNCSLDFRFSSLESIIYCPLGY